MNADSVTALEAGYNYVAARRDELLISLERVVADATDALDIAYSNLENGTTVPAQFTKLEHQLRFARATLAKVAS